MTESLLSSPAADHEHYGGVDLGGDWVRYWELIFKASHSDSDTKEGSTGVPECEENTTVSITSCISVKTKINENKIMAVGIRDLGSNLSLSLNWANCLTSLTFTLLGC